MFTSKKILEFIEADLQKGADIQNAQRVLQRYIGGGGRGVPLILVKESIKVLYKHSQNRKIKKTTESITKYSNRIDKNMTKHRGQLDDLEYEITTLLETIEINGDIEMESDEENEEELAKGISYIKSLLHAPKDANNKRRAIESIALPDVPTTKLPSDDENNSDGTGGSAVPVVENASEV